jgi:hypothetical protein
MTVFLQGTTLFLPIPRKKKKIKKEIKTSPKKQTCKLIKSARLSDVESEYRTFTKIFVVEQKRK